MPMKLMEFQPIVQELSDAFSQSAFLLARSRILRSGLPGYEEFVKAKLRDYVKGSIGVYSQHAFTFLRDEFYITDLLPMQSHGSRMVVNAICDTVQGELRKLMAFDPGFNVRVSLSPQRSVVTPPYRAEFTLTASPVTPEPHNFPKLVQATDLYIEAHRRLNSCRIGKA